MSGERRPSGRRKQVAKFRPTMPPRSAIIASWRSVRLRVDGHDRVGVGMGGDQRRGRERGHVVEAGGVQVGEVDRASAARCRPGPGPGRRRSGPGRCRGRRGSGTARRGRRASAGSRPGRASAGPRRAARGARRGRGRSPRRPPCASPRRWCPPARQARISRRVRQSRRRARHALQPQQDPGHGERHRLRASRP